MKPFLTVADLAQRLNVSASTVYDLVSQKKISCFRIGGRGRGAIRFTEEQVEAYLAASLREAEANPPPSSSAPASSDRSAGPFSELDPDRLRKAWGRG